MNASEERTRSQTNNGTAQCSKKTDLLKQQWTIELTESFVSQESDQDLGSPTFSRLSNHLFAEVEVPQLVQQRLDVIQSLMEYRGTKDYQKMQQLAAQTLGVSRRTVQRLVKAWQEKGIDGLARQERSDKGKAKTSRQWQEFILKTWQEGNQSSQMISPAQVAVKVKIRASELQIDEYPSHMTVYRLLQPHIKAFSGWQQKALSSTSGLSLKTPSAQDIKVEYSNHVWQCFHTQVNVYVVDRRGKILGKPWLTLIVDTYSEAIIGFYLGMEAPCAAIVCLALRHAILPKHSKSDYGLKQIWATYGLPKYLYIDQGKDFQSLHLEQVASQLEFVCCQRGYSAVGEIVEPPFGTFNSELFANLPGYTGWGAELVPHSRVMLTSLIAEKQACLTLEQLEKLLVRYIVDHYNLCLNPRTGNQTRITLWEAGRIATLPLLRERELDICLMLHTKRRVYQGGYLQLANLTYRGKHLARYAGKSVRLRYNPRDITTVLVYEDETKEGFICPAQALEWERQSLSMAEAKALAAQMREQGRSINNRSLLLEITNQEAELEKLDKIRRHTLEKTKPNCQIESLLTQPINAEQWLFEWLSAEHDLGRNEPNNKSDVIGKENYFSLEKLSTSI